MSHGIPCGRGPSWGDGNDVVATYHHLSLQAHCEKLIKKLCLPEPFTELAFFDYLAERRQRPIEVIAASLGSTVPCGMLISTQDVDYICHSDTVTPLHGQHIRLHEAFHLAYGHTGTASARSGTLTAEHKVTQMQPPGGFDPHHRPANIETLQKILPKLDTQLIRRLLGRTVYQKQEEREAEMSASIMMAAISQPTAGLLKTRAWGIDVEVDQLRMLFGEPMAGCRG